MPINTTDQALVFAAQSGNDACFEELYKRYYDKTYALAKTTLKNEADAQDVLQSTFIKAWRNLGSLSDPSAFNTWLGRITLNECYSILRSRKSAVSIDDEGEEGEVLQLESDLLLPAEYAERGDLSVRLTKIISELSEVQRETVVLYYYQELSIEEIAAAMDCSAGTVKSRLFLARRALKTEIEEQERRSGEKFYGLALPFGGIFARQIRNTMLPPQQAMQIYDSVSRTLFGTGSGMAGSTAGAANAFSSGTSGSMPVHTASAHNLAGNAVRAAGGKAAGSGAAKAAASGAGTVAKALWLKITAGIVAGAVTLGGAAYGITKAVQSAREEPIAVVEETSNVPAPQEISEPDRTMREINPETLPESLEIFLNQFHFGYIDSADGKEYDCENPDWHLILHIATNGSCVNLSHPVDTVKTVEADQFDPLGKYTEKGYITFREKNVLWIAENIFHTGSDRAEELLEYALREGIFLYEFNDLGETCLCNRFFGVGGPGYEINFRFAKTDGERYYVTYDRKIEGGSDYDAETWYAEVSEEELDGEKYWTLYRHSAETPAQARVTLPESFTPAYRAYIRALEEHYKGIFGAQTSRQDCYVALSDIYGSDTPELLFWESEDGSYSSPQILTVMTYEKGALKTLWHGKPGESFFSFALYRRENEKALWFIDYMPVVDSGYTIISSFEENHGMLSLCERAYYSAMYNMSDSSDYHYDYVWRVEGKETDEAEFRLMTESLLSGEKDLLMKTPFMDADPSFKSLEERSMTVDEAIDLLYRMIGEERPSETQTEIFSKFAGHYVFTSGVGGWASELTLEEDGTFQGQYSDSTYVTGADYQVMLDVCSFEGRFENARRIDGVTYVFDLMKLDCERTPGETERVKINGVDTLVTYTTAYGFDTSTRTVYAYSADAYRYVLPDKFLGWVDLLRSDRYSSTLDYNCLFSYEPGYGWLGPKAETQE